MVDDFGLTRSALQRLGRSTLKTLPTLLDFIRVGISKFLEVSKSDLILSPDTDTVVKLDEFILRHVPSSGAWYSIPKGIVSLSMVNKSLFELSSDGKRIRVKTRGPKKQSICAGIFTMEYAYLNFDMSKLREYYLAGLARTIYGEPPMIHVIDED